jgi:cell division protein FtsN
MSRDYKPRNIPANKPRPGGSLLIGIFIGLLLGLAIAVGVAWYMNHAQIPFVNRFKPPEKTSPVPPEPVPAINGVGGAQGTGMPPAVGQLPGQQTAPDRPRFDFYKILPGTEEPVTDQQIKQAGQAAPVDSGKIKFFLQAGSFQNSADAENLKARLALIGVEAAVQTSDLGEKGIWNRVLIGPYAKIEDTGKLRQQLAENGIEATMIKVKDAPR